MWLKKYVTNISLGFAIVDYTLHGALPRTTLSTQHPKLPRPLELTLNKQQEIQMWCLHLLQTHVNTLNTMH